MLRRIPILILMAMLFAGVTAIAQSSGRKALHTNAPAIVSKLTPLGLLPPTNRLQLAIGLPLKDHAGLDAFLQQVYDPASTNYHKYLTPQQFTERFGPTESDYQSVIHFAQTNGLTVVRTFPNRVVLDVEGSVADIQRAFHVTLHLYQHPAEARTFYAPDVEPSVDATLPVLDVSGLDNFSLPHPNSQKKTFNDITPKSGSGSSGSYAGNDFRAAYIPGVTLTGSNQSVALLEFDGYYTADITRYESSFGLPAVPLVNVAVDGGVAKPGTGNSEVALDIEMVIAMAPGLSSVLIYEAPNPSPWPDLLNAIANDNLARQISCSWGGGSPDATSEQIFKQMAAQGQSFYNASGDSDAFTGPIPFPSDSTNITQVGATTLSTTGPGGSWSSETVWNWGRQQGSYVGSSGGISTYYSIPGWQLGINMVTNLGSTTMRNVPDVALTGDNIQVDYNNGSTGIFGGTSCAAPLWAAFTALVNQQAAAANSPPMGFINPAIYSIGKGTNYLANFHDITTGNNFSRSSPTQFSAVPGYDLCTGWGTPNGNLISVLAPPVASTNHAPVLSAIANKTIYEMTALTFTNSATDQDGNALTFSLLAGAPTNATINQTSGVFSWTPTEAQGPSTNSITVQVTDNGKPPLSATQTFTVFVLESNLPPVLAPISDKTIYETTTLLVTNTATDPDIPTNTLTFSLDVAPTNASINAGTGIFQWTPNEFQGPSTNSITVRVTDNGVPPLSATQSFTVIVLESNQAPVLAPISNRTIFEQTTLIFTNIATDADWPTQTLTFTLDPGAPTNASINQTSGVFNWTPTEVQGPSTNSITVRVTDNGTPPLSAAQSFTVTVLESNLPPVLMAISNRTIHAGFTLTITNSATDPDIPTNILTFSISNSPLSAVINASNGVLVWTPDNTFTGTTNSFTVRVTDNGVPPLSDAKSFSVVVVLPPSFSSTNPVSFSNGIMTIFWNAIPGQTYAVQTNGDLGGTNWNSLLPYVTATNSTASKADSIAAPFKFYRVVPVP